MKHLREIKAAVLAVVALFILYFGFSFLKGINIFSSVKTYHGTYAVANKLVEQSPVYIRGYKVGLVERIVYDFRQDSAFAVSISVASDIALPEGTVMAIVADGLMGGTAIELQLPVDQANRSILSNGAKLPTTVVPSLMEGMQAGLLAKVESAVGQADELIQVLRGQLADNHLYNILENVDSVSNSLTAVAADVRVFTDQRLPRIAENADTLVANLSCFSNRLNAVDIDGTMGKVDSAVAGVNTLVAKINNADGTVGALINDRELYTHIDRTVVSVDSLVTDLKAHPKRYVHFSLFGRKDKAKTEKK